MNDTEIISLAEPAFELPPIIAGHESPVVIRKVEKFYGTVAEMFEAWLERTPNYHTKRSYHRGVKNLIEFLEIRWPEDSWKLLRTTVPDIHDWHRFMSEDLDQAPSTLNHRICAASAFFEYLKRTSEALKLPINVANPAHRTFVKRPDPSRLVEPKVIPPGMLRKLMGFPKGDSPVAVRDRTALIFYIFSAARIRTGTLLEAHDIVWDEKNPTINLQEKGRGKTKRTVGVHFEAVDALKDLMTLAGITSGPVFRVQKNWKSEELGKRGLKEAAMYNTLKKYLAMIPGAMIEVQAADGSAKKQCIYSPHSLRRSTATFLLELGVEPKKVQELLGHKQIETTMKGYDLRQFDTKEGASHLLRI